MAFVDRIPWATPVRRAPHTGLRVLRTYAQTLFRQRSPDEALVVASSRGLQGAWAARRALRRGAAYNAEDFLALRRLHAGAGDYAEFVRTAEKFGFKQLDLSCFAYKLLEDAALARYSRADPRTLETAVKLIDSQEKPEWDNWFRALQLQVIPSASDETIKALLDIRPNGYNEMLDEMRRSFTSGAISQIPAAR
jgi:hypothetical protein